MARLAHYQKIGGSIPPPATKLHGENMTLETIEQKINALRSDIAEYHRITKVHYEALDARLDSGLTEVRKSKWTPVFIFLYTLVVLMFGMALERWS